MMRPYVVSQTKIVNVLQSFSEAYRVAECNTYPLIVAVRKRTNSTRHRRTFQQLKTTLRHGFSVIDAKSPLTAFCVFDPYDKLQLLNRCVSR